EPLHTSHCTSGIWLRIRRSPQYEDASVPRLLKVKVKVKEQTARADIPILPPRERESRLGRGQPIWISARVGIVVQASLSCSSQSLRCRAARDCLATPRARTEPFLPAAPR